MKYGVFFSVYILKLFAKIIFISDEFSEYEQNAQALLRDVIEDYCV